MTVVSDMRLMHDFIFVFMHVSCKMMQE